MTFLHLSKNSWNLLIAPDRPAYRLSSLGHVGTSEEGFPHSRSNSSNVRLPAPYVLHKIRQSTHQPPYDQLTSSSPRKLPSVCSVEGSPHSKMRQHKHSS